jgi:hypothetical protein
MGGGISTCSRILLPHVISPRCFFSQGLCRPVRGPPSLCLNEYGVPSCIITLPDRFKHPPIAPHSRQQPLQNNQPAYRPDTSLLDRGRL